MNDSAWPDGSKWPNGSNGTNNSFPSENADDAPDVTRIQSFSMPVEPHQDTPEGQQPPASPPSAGYGTQPPASPGYGQPPAPPAPPGPADYQPYKPSGPAQPGYQAPAAPGYQPPPPPGGYQAPYQQPGQPGGYPSAQPYQPYPAPQPYSYGYGDMRPRTNGMAIASMVCSLVFFLYGIPSLVGLILGLVSLNQIKQRGEGGKGMAITGIVLGALGIVGWIIFFIVIAVVIAHAPSTGTGISNG